MRHDTRRNPTALPEQEKPLTRERTQTVVLASHRSAEDGREHVRTSWMAMARSAEVLKRCRS